MDADSIPYFVERSIVLQDQYKFEESLDLLKAALKAAVFNQNDESQAKIYAILGKNYESIGLTKKAKDNYSTARTYARITGDKTLEAKLNNDLGRIYSKTPGLEDRALTSYDTSYKLAIELKDSSLIVKPLINMARYYMDQKDFRKGYNYLSPAEKFISKKTTAVEDKARFNMLLARYYNHKKDFEREEFLLSEAVSFTKKSIDDEKNKSRLIQLYDVLAEVHEMEAELNKNALDFEKALWHTNELNTYNKKSRELKKSIALQKAFIKFDVALKDEEIKRTKQDRAAMNNKEIKWQISVILGVVVILISLAFLISSYKNNIQKKKLNNDLIDKNKELNKAKETAEQVSTLKSQFISTVSHELRTPLYGVIGLTSLLMEDPDHNKRKEYLESLKFSGDYLLALINDVLQLSKIETKEVKLEKVPFDLKTLIEGIVNSLHSKQKKNNNKVHVEIDSKIDGNLLGDSVRLSQVLINLIGNALKFTKNGNIWVKVTCKDYTADKYDLEFTIQDDGIGIPKSKQINIFDNFAQVKNENQEYQGTGLGLAIVRKLIHLHDSEIHIDSEEGVGSKFYFDLRYPKALNKEKKGEKEIETLSIGTTNFNILIVDDNKINQIVTQNILKKKGYTCELASDGEMAVDMAKHNEFDLILMDINMPKMNGLEATAEIRTFDPAIPIIALTAVEEGEIRDEAISVGMNDVIIKPYDTQQFFQTIIKNISKVKLS